MKSKFAVLLILTIFTVNAIAQQTNKKPFIYSLPGLSGAFQVDLAAWQLTEATYRPDGSGLKLAATGPEGFNMTIFLETAKSQGSAQDVRKDWWGKTRKGTPFELSAIKQFESPNSASVEYMIKNVDIVKGFPTAGYVSPNQKNVHSYLASNQVWIEVHISKTLFKPGDQQLIDDTLQGAKPLPEYVASSRDNWIYAGHFYEMKNYRRAADFYEKSLEMEKQQRKLPDVLWFVLIDNLGMSYGISGDLKRARETFDYGISVHPEYPMFYYNLACASGESNDVDGAIAYLQKAFDRRANVLKGEGMPDPLKDDSFKRFLKSKKFTDAVASLQK